MNKLTIVERLADKGEPSHWELMDDMNISYGVSTDRLRLKMHQICLLSKIIFIDTEPFLTTSSNLNDLLKELGYLQQ